MKGEVKLMREREMEWEHGITNKKGFGRFLLFFFCLFPYLFQELEASIATGRGL